MSLATQHEVLPSTLFITGVEKIEDEALVSGGFADVYYGKAGIQAVAIKCLRPFHQVGEASKHKLQQVRCLLDSSLFVGKLSILPSRSTVNAFSGRA